MSVRYRSDPALLGLSLSAGDLLGSTGRAVNCTTAIIDHYEREFSCSTSGSEPFATGDGTLVEYTIAAASDLGGIRPHFGNGGLAPLGVDLEILDGEGGAIAVASAIPPAVFLRALEGDLTEDCLVDSTDLLLVGAAYPSAFGAPLFDRKLDLVPASGDDVIDVGDVQFVLGRLGSTCEDPIPPQDPPAAGVSADADGDGILDIIDNCPETSNQLQTGHRR